MECNRLSSIGDPTIDQSRFQFIYASCLLKYGEILLVDGGNYEANDSEEDLIDFFRASRDFAQPWALQSGSINNVEFCVVFIKSLIHLASFGEAVEYHDDKMCESITRMLPDEVDLLLTLAACICRSTIYSANLINQSALLVAEKLKKIANHENFTTSQIRITAELLLWRSSGLIEKLEAEEGVDEEGADYRNLIETLNECVRMLKMADAPKDASIHWLFCEANLHLADWTFEENASEILLQTARNHAKLCNSIDSSIIPQDIKEALL